MQITTTRPARSRVAAWAQVSPSRSRGGQKLLIAVVAGVTWLALVGGLLSEYILTDAAGLHSHSRPSYAAYNVLQAAPTSFGTLSVSRADLVPNTDAVQVDVSLLVANTRDAQTDAPRLEDLRLINTDGVDVTTTPGKWNGPAVLVAHSSASIDLEYVAPRNAGLLWLEYGDAYGQWPIRIALGDAPGVAQS